MRKSQLSASSRPAGDRHAVDGADDRLGRGEHRALPGSLGRRAPGRASGRGALERSAVGAELFQVEPGAEGGIGTGEDEHVDVVAALGLSDDDGERHDELARQRVARLGPVEGDGGDAVGHIEGARRRAREEGRGSVTW
jgi:hypothetical protein